MSERNGDDRDERDERRDDRDMEDDDRDRKVEEVMDIEKEDAAFVLGRGGSTKRKIARVCGAELELDEHNLTIPCDRSRLPEQTLAIDHFVLGGTWTGYATRQPARVSRPRKVGLERANRTEPYYRSSLQ